MRIFAHIITINYEERYFYHSVDGHDDDSCHPCICAGGEQTE